MSGLLLYWLLTTALPATVATLTTNAALLLGLIFVFCTILVSVVAAAFRSSHAQSLDTTDFASHVAAPIAPILPADPVSRRRFQDIATLDDILALPPTGAQGFEGYIGYLFKRTYGMEYTLTARSGDGGIDLILTLGDIQAIVQCKQYRTEYIEPDKIRALSWPMQRQKATYAFFVTTSRVSAKAWPEFTNSGIRIIDRQFLLEWIAGERKPFPLEVERRFARIRSAAQVKPLTYS